MSGKQPDYRVQIGAAYEQGAERPKGSTTIGAAWVNRAGGISVKLNPGLTVILGAGCELTLWPPKDGDRGGSSGGGGRGGGGPGPAIEAPKDNFGDDDVPFLVDETTRDGAP